MDHASAAAVEFLRVLLRLPLSPFSPLISLILFILFNSCLIFFFFFFLLNIFQTETALIYDAVHLFAQALHDLDHSQNIDTKPLSCDGSDTWQHGNSLVNYMKLVRRSIICAHMHTAHCRRWIFSSHHNRMN